MADAKGLKELDSHSRKLPDYYERYESHFAARRNEPLKMLEIGVQYGGSVAMWASYFPNAQITGVDIDPACRMHAGKRVQIFIGDQADASFLSQFKGFDIIVDDGGHTMRQQQVSFQTLFPLKNPGGIYVVEDLHTSYWPEFFDAPQTTMDFLLSLAHFINAPATKDERSAKPLEDPYGISEMHFYQSLCFICKDREAKVLHRPTARPGGMGYFAHRFIARAKEHARRLGIGRR